MGVMAVPAGNPLHIGTNRLAAPGTITATEYSRETWKQLLEEQGHDERDNRPTTTQRTAATVVFTERWYVETARLGDRDAFKDMVARVGAVRRAFGGVAAYELTYERCMIRVKVIADNAKIVQDWRRFLIGPEYMTDEVAQVVLNVLDRDNRYVVAIPPCSKPARGDAREALVVIPLYDGKTEYVFDITPKARGEAFVVDPKEVEPRIATALPHCSSATVSGVRQIMTKHVEIWLTRNPVLFIPNQKGGGMDKWFRRAQNRRNEGQPFQPGPPRRPQLTSSQFGYELRALTFHVLQQ
jgi:hypothetical protein